MQLFPRLLRLMDTAGKKEEPGFPVSTEKKDGNNYEERENRETLAGLIPLPSGIYYGSSRPACIRPDGKKQQELTFQPFGPLLTFQKTVLRGQRRQDAGCCRSSSEGF